jgi:hypothetical protein
LLKSYILEDQNDFDMLKEEDDESNIEANPFLDEGEEENL